MILNTIIIYNDEDLWEVGGIRFETSSNFCVARTKHITTGFGLPSYAFQQNNSGARFHRIQDFKQYLWFVFAQWIGLAKVLALEVEDFLQKLEAVWHVTCSVVGGIWTRDLLLLSPTFLPTEPSRPPSSSSTIISTVLRQPLNLERPCAALDAAVGIAWLEMKCIWYGSFYFVCDHGKHRNAKQYNFVRILWSSPPCPKSYTQNRTAYKQMTRYVISSHGQSRNPHIAWVP